VTSVLYIRPTAAVFTICGTAPSSGVFGSPAAVKARACRAADLSPNFFDLVSRLLITCLFFLGKSLFDLACSEIRTHWVGGADRWVIIPVLPSKTSVMNWHPKESRISSSAWSTMHCRNDWEKWARSSLWRVAGSFLLNFREAFSQLLNFLFFPEFLLSAVRHMSRGLIIVLRTTGIQY